MWLYESNRGEEEKRLPGDEKERLHHLILDGSRGYGHAQERYWARIFGVTTADLAAMAEAIQAKRDACDLTTLSKVVIRTRLQDGPQLNSGPAPSGYLGKEEVRPWDADATWRPGDRAIVIVPLPHAGRAYAPRIGQVIHVEDDHIAVKIDGLRVPQLYPGETQRFTSCEGVQERLALETELTALAANPFEEAQVDFVLWRYGHHVATKVLQALKMDRRFLELDGLWFLRELTRRPTDGDLIFLARVMFNENLTSLSMEGVLARTSISPDDTAGRFGLLLSLREETNLFETRGSGSRPHWELVAPPPMRMVARQAVYDPETYEILCVPGETLSSPVAQRLWHLELLHTAVKSKAPVSSRATLSDSPSRPAAPTSPPSGQPARSSEDPNASERDRAQRARSGVELSQRSTHAPSTSSSGPPAYSKAKPKASPKPPSRGLRWPKWLPFGPR